MNNTVSLPIEIAEKQATDIGQQFEVTCTPFGMEGSGPFLQSIGSYISESLPQLLHNTGIAATDL